jgi:hypothetical protein
MNQETGRVLLMEEKNRGQRSLASVPLRRDDTGEAENYNITVPVTLLKARSQMLSQSNEQLLN